MSCMLQFTRWLQHINKYTETLMSDGHGAFVQRWGFDAGHVRASGHWMTSASRCSGLTSNGDYYYSNRGKKESFLVDLLSESHVRRSTCPNWFLSCLNVSVNEDIICLSLSYLSSHLLSLMTGCSHLSQSLLISSVTKPSEPITVQQKWFGPIRDQSQDDWHGDSHQGSPPHHQGYLESFLFTTRSF